MRSYSVLGNIALVNFPREFKGSKINFAKKILKENKSVKTVLEKVGKFSGRLRKISTKWLAGEKNKEVLYKENNCVFRFNIDSTYFSPRLSNERKEIAGLVKKDENVLVMFAGVSPFSIVIAKNSKIGRSSAYPKLRNAKVYSNEINREANKYAKLNIELNKLKERVELLPGDIKKVTEKILKGWRENHAVSVGGKEKMPPSRALQGISVSRKEREENKGLPRFDVIVMPRPQLKDSFLEQAFKLSKRGTRIYYYDFCKIDALEGTKYFDLIIKKIKDEAKKAGKKIRIVNKKLAGDIAPYKYRVRVDFIIL